MVTRVIPVAVPPPAKTTRPSRWLIPVVALIGPVKTNSLPTAEPPTNVPPADAEELMVIVPL